MTTEDLALKTILHRHSSSFIMGVTAVTAMMLLLGVVTGLLLLYFYLRYKRRTLLAATGTDAGRTARESESEQ